MSAITLPLGASAEPDTCGSCKFFERKDDNAYYAMHGLCTFQLPPKVVERWSIRQFQDQLSKINRDFTGNEDQMKDTDRCDLYRFSGQVYIVQRRIPPERAG